MTCSCRIPSSAAYDGTVSSSTGASAANGELSTDRFGELWVEHPDSDAASNGDATNGVGGATAALLNAGNGGITQAGGALVAPLLQSSGDSGGLPNSRMSAPATNVLPAPMSTTACGVPVPPGVVCPIEPVTIWPRVSIVSVPALAIPRESWIETFPTEFSVRFAVPLLTGDVSVWSAAPGPGRPSPCRHRAG